MWNQSDLEKIIKEDFPLFSQVFNINEFGYWENDNYVLIQNQSLETIAKSNKIKLSELQTKKKNWEKLLFDEREKRSKPRLDDKSLTSWNAIMLKGYLDAYKALGDENYLEIALKNAHFIIDKLWKPEGNILHSYKNGKANINGYLEDYCFVIDAFISLYEVTIDDEWLRLSKQLTDYCFDNFYDETAQFFSFTSKNDDPLIATHFETEDNVIPASNSVMASNLFQLSVYFQNQYYESICMKMLKIIIPNIDYPSAYSNWLNVLMNYSKQQKELGICGVNAIEYLSKINREYHPNLLLAGANKISELPFLKDRYVGNEMLFYVCQNQTCQLPTSNFNEVLNKI